jgi:multiple sugar transport system permease protein
MALLRNRWRGYVFLLPALVTVLFIVVYPLFMVLQLGFREGRSLNFSKIGQQPLGLANYTAMLTDSALWNSVRISALYVGGSALASFAIGLLTALLLNERFPCRSIFRALLLLPWAVPGVIVSINFIWLFDASYGVVNAVLRDIGATTNDIAWFGDGRTALFAVMLPTIWKGYPFCTLTLLAAMQSVPESLYEAAQIDGASRLARFRYVTWPGIRSAGILALFLSALWMFRDFDIIYAATGGGPSRATETLSLFVYNEAFLFFRMGTASAVGTIMVVVAAVACLIAMRSIKREYF